MERSRILNWQHWSRQTADLKPAEVKTQIDRGCRTADKRARGHVPPAFSRSNSEARKIAPKVAHCWVWLRTGAQSSCLHPKDARCSSSPCSGRQCERACAHVHARRLSPLRPAGSLQLPSSSVQRGGGCKATTTHRRLRLPGPWPSCRFIFFPCIASFWLCVFSYVQALSRPVRSVIWLTHVTWESYTWEQERLAGPQPRRS